MKWIGQHIWDFISRFRNKVYFENLEGSAFIEALVVDGEGRVFTNTLSAGSSNGEATKVRLLVRFDEGVSKGDPVYIKGYHGSTGPVIVAKADANDIAKMPAFGLADADYSRNEDGYAISIGNLVDLDTSGYLVGDTLYVDTGGGLTNTKPTTQANLIQNVGTVARDNANNGQVEVVATGRSNDVPNLNDGYIFYGNANNQSVPTLLSSLTTSSASVTTIKILPRDFIADDSGRPVQIDDGTSGTRFIESDSTSPLFASVEIPPGFKATHVDIYGNGTSAVTVYEANINTRAVTSKGTGNIGTPINFTDVTSNATNYLLIELAQASGEQVNGGKVTIAKA